MAKIICVGQPANDAERQAIAYLRDELPDSYTVIHNFEMMVEQEMMEIDLVVLMPHCVYLVDIKGVHGLVDVYGSKWYPENREPYRSPLLKGEKNAKKLKTFLTDHNRTHPELHKMYVRATVLLTDPDAQIDDHTLDHREAKHIVHLNKCQAYFRNPANVPPDRSHDIRALLPLIERTIRGGTRPPTRPQIYRDWQVEERLGGNERYTEYRARHLPRKKSTARLRVYRANPYQDKAAREHEQKMTSNAYRSIANLPGHPHVLGVREFFEDEDGSYFVLVTEDVHGNALSMHIKKPSLALTFDQKRHVIRDVLTALEHAHTHQVIHRNLNPDTIIISADGRTLLSSFEYARAASNTSSIAPYITDDLDQNYQAPECYRDPSQASKASDLFSAGLVFYELLTGESAFTSPEQLYDVSGVFPMRPSELRPELSPALDDWLQQLCAFNSHQRFVSAADALRAFDQSLSMSSPPVSNRRNEEEMLPAPVLEKRNLPCETILDDRFVVQELLGQGGFATVYKVFDSTAEVMRVLKLVLADHMSVYQRLRQEYKTLEQLPPHPYVSRVVWADQLADGTPYILFEYVKGLDVKKVVEEHTLSLEDALTLASQVAEGLAHLHDHGVYHQDIKPSNLLWTGHSVRIIDFNVAVSDQNSGQVRGGTRRYIPPDLERVNDLSSDQKRDCDLYALGITLYECITGHYPFLEPNVRKTMSDPRTFEGCKNLNQDIVAFLDKACHPQASARFASALEMRAALNALLPKLPEVPAPPREGPEVVQVSRRAIAIGIAGIVVASAVGGGILALAHQDALGSDRTRVIYRGHTDVVRFVAWSPNGQIVSASWDQTAQVWNASDGRHLFTYTRHSATVYAVAWSPDGKRIASCSGDWTVQVWNASDGSDVLIYRGHSFFVHRVAWSPDGKQIASCSYDKTVQVWNASDGRGVFTYRRHTDRVFGVAWSPDGKWLASASRDRTAQVWNAYTVIVYKGHTNFAETAAWSPDGKRIASGSDDKTVQIWDASNGRPLFTYTGHSATVYAVVWSPDGKQIASASADKTVQIWDVE